jgi:transposase
MQTITTIGLDIAKSVFQVHGIDAEGTVVLRRQFKRRYVLAFFQKLPPCLVGIEACASAHHRSRELKAVGHAVDAEAICEAVTRANLRFVAPEQQSSRSRRRGSQGNPIQSRIQHVSHAPYSVISKVGTAGGSEELGSPGSDTATFL